MSASHGQDSRRNLALRAALGLLLKLVLAAVAIGVGYLLGWPAWKMLGLALMVWLVIDLIMTWQEERRTERGEFELLNNMVGESGVVTTAFVRQGEVFHGRIWVHGESWAAMFPGHRALEPGERIRVGSRDGLTLVVYPDEEAGTNRKQSLS